MLQNEFEERIGRKATAEEYCRANAIYNETNLNKDNFCAEWESIKDSEAVLDLAHRANGLCTEYHTMEANNKQLYSMLIDMMYKNEDFSQRNNIITIMGQKAYIKYVIAQGYEIQDADREIIADLIG